MEGKHRSLYCNLDLLRGKPKGIPHPPDLKLAQCFFSQFCYPFDPNSKLLQKNHNTFLTGPLHLLLTSPSIWDPSKSVKCPFRSQWINGHFSSISQSGSGLKLLHWKMACHTLPVVNFLIIPFTTITGLYIFYAFVIKLQYWFSF